MEISGYGVSYNYSGYGSSANKDKTSSAFAVALDEKIKTESKKNSNANQTSQTYNPFEDMARTNSVSLPSYIYTKTEPTRSDEEILKDIVEVAKKHGRQGTFMYEDEEFKSLTKEWVSSVSPDREEILKDAMKEIDEKKHSINKKDIGEKDFDLIDMLMQALKMGNEINKTGGGCSEKVINDDGSFILNMKGDTFEACVDEGIVKFVSINDDSGKAVLLFDSIHGSGQLEQIWTEEEGLRNGELGAVYLEAYKSVNDSNSFVSGNTFKAAG
ncbi:MAG: hypothetical protein LBC87_00545 [Fibromonadaceae bacterium]|jgi:hypothetical protein|nr:hypothetical protein [Fibromonadaceae bacterium]